MDADADADVATMTTMMTTGYLVRQLGAVNDVIVVIQLQQQQQHVMTCERR